VCRWNSITGKLKRSDITCVAEAAPDAITGVIPVARTLLL